MAWVKWEELCRAKKEGGLGIKDLRWFNLALLSKWIWRFLVDKETLWIRMIKSRHENVVCNQEGMQVEGRGPRGAGSSGWWRKLVSVVGGPSGRWFWGKLVLKLGDGRCSHFWLDPWAGEGRLKDRFPRLFHLSANADAKVAEMEGWVDGKWRWKPRWRRNFLEREKQMVEEFQAVIHLFQLREGEVDQWSWGGDNKGLFSVKEGYNSIVQANPIVNPAGREGGWPSRI